MRRLDLRKVLYTGMCTRQVWFGKDTHKCTYNRNMIWWGCTRVNAQYYYDLVRCTRVYVQYKYNLVRMHTSMRTLLVWYCEDSHIYVQYKYDLGKNHRLCGIGYSKRFLNLYRGKNSWTWLSYVNQPVKNEKDVFNYHIQSANSRLLL